MGKIKGQHSWDQTTWAEPSASPSRPQRNLFVRTIVGMGKIIGGFIGLIAVAGIGATLINTFSSPDAPAQAVEEQESPAYVRMIAKDAVRKLPGWKDADSLKFGELYVFQKSVLGKHTVCGTVNAKNSFGGYEGMRHFITDGTLALTVIDNGSNEFRELWKLWCKDQPEQPSVSPQ